MNVEPDLFAVASENLEPLAARMRPQSLDEVVGQTHLLGVGQPLRRAIESNTLHSFILWGPPGVGKTTLARLVSVYSDALFLQLSAVFSGVKDIRSAIDQAREAGARGRRTAFESARALLRTPHLQSRKRRTRWHTTKSNADADSTLKVKPIGNRPRKTSPPPPLTFPYGLAHNYLYGT